MLSIAISTFFALAFVGSATVVAAMFFQYRDKIVNVIQNASNAEQSGAFLQPTAYRHRIVKTSQPMSQNRLRQPVPLRVAA